MDDHPAGRRSFLKKVAAMSIAVPAVGSLATANAKPMSYDPAAKFGVKISETEFRRTAAGRQLIARIYQPQGAGTVPDAARPARRRLEQQGPLRQRADGSRRRGERRARGRDRHDARARGALPRFGPGRELRRALAQGSNAPTWNGDPATLGVLGSSTGGHIAELLGMRPRDRALRRDPAARARRTSTRRVAYVATRSPISDPYARYQQAERMKREDMMKNTQELLRCRGRRSTRPTRSRSSSDASG